LALKTTQRVLIEKLMTLLHEATREQVKKKKMDHSIGLASGQKNTCNASVESKAFAIQGNQWD
jgi:hypothetical protein